MSTNPPDDYGQKSVALREELGGLLGSTLKVPLETKDDLSVCYTPGIAEPCRRIAAQPELSRTLTVRKNTVAVISDGSAVLGLGNIGAAAALPVMEGKCMLLKRFADIDGVPIVLDTQDTDELVRTIIALAPSFGGINLEDIAAPRCFEIEKRVAEAVDIPVFHDDQHGTAMVTLAALINALRITKRDKKDARIVINGAGAAGIAIAALLRAWGCGRITLVDSKGIVACSRTDLHDSKRDFCVEASGDLAQALTGADVFIGVSKPGLLTPAMIATMNQNPIIFAMANPVPEIFPDAAHAAGAAVVATGRSDFPNQINNVLIFPGFFRGLLDSQTSSITQEMKLAAAIALSAIVEEPTSQKILPSPLEPGVAERVAQAVKNK